MVKKNNKPVAFILFLAMLFTMTPVGVLPMEVYADTGSVMHDITVESSAHGTVTVDKTEAKEYDTVTVTVKPDSDAYLQMLEIIYIKDDGQYMDFPEAQGDDDQGNEVYTFEMPDYDVTVMAQFVTKAEVDVYRVVIPEAGELDNGSIAVSNVVLANGEVSKEMPVTYGGKVHADEKIKVTVNPDSGYRLKSLSVLSYDEDADAVNPRGETITPKRITGRTYDYIFTMPAHAVKINAVFEPGPSFAPREKASLSTNVIANPDLGETTARKTYDTVNFAGRIWFVLSNTNGKLLLLDRNPLSSTAIPYSNVDAALTEFVSGWAAECQSCLVSMSENGSYTDITYSDTGEEHRETYTQNTATGAKAFLLSVEDMRKYSPIESQLAPNASNEYWLSSSCSGGQAYVANGGLIKATTSEAKKVRAAVLVDTSKVIMTTVEIPTSEYVRTGDDLDGAPGQNWNLLVRNTELEEVNIPGMYRDTDAAGNQTNNVVVVTEKTGKEPYAIIAVRNNTVIYFNKVSSKSEFSDTRDAYTFANVLNKIAYDSNKASTKFYIIGMTADSLKYSATKLYEEKLHEHTFGYTSSKSGEVTTISMNCKTNDGTKCFLDTNQMKLTVTSPAIVNPLKYDGAAKTIELAYQSKFAPNPVRVQYLIDDGKAEPTYTNTLTDPFQKGSGAATNGAAPKEDGKYKARITLENIGQIFDIPFTVGCDVYQIVVGAPTTGSGLVSYSHDDLSPINGRPHAGATVTINVTASAGYLVDGLKIETLSGTYKTFDTEVYNPTGVAVMSFTVSMPAAHIKLTPLYRPHEHFWSEEWSSNSSAHWHDCLAPNCDKVLTERDGYESHTTHYGLYYDNGDGTDTRKCAVCGYKDTNAHNWTEWTTDDAMHYHYCDKEGCTASESAAHESFYVWKNKSDHENGHWKECSECHYITGAAAHIYDQELTSGAVAVAATCTHGTIYYKTCVCGYCYANASTPTFEAVSTKLPHTYNMSDWRYDGTNHYHYCTKCNDQVDVVAHTWVNSTDPAFRISSGTCSDPAVFYKSCSECGTTSSATFAAFIVEHSLTSKTGVEYKVPGGEPTCQHAQQYYYSCTRCNATVDAIFEDGLLGDHVTSTALTGDAIGHFYICDVCHEHVFSKSHHIVATTEDACVVPGLEPTCERDGVYYKHCDQCGYIFTEPTPDNNTGFMKVTEVTFAGVRTQLPHNFCKYVPISRLGHYLTCTYCGISDLDDSITGLSYDGYHSHTGHYVTTEGGHTYYCPTCGYTLYEKHSNDTSAYGYPNCQSPDLCMYCSATYGSIDMDNHLIRFIPSLVNEDYHVWEYTCDHEPSGTTHSSAHSWVQILSDDRRVGDEPTCTHGATYYYTCEDCGYVSTTETFYTTADMKPHDYSGKVSALGNLRLAKAATCEEPAEYYHCCKNCGKIATSSIMGSQYVDTFTSGSALGHTINNAVIASSDASFHYQYCEVCGHEVKTAHEYNVKIVDGNHKVEGGDPSCATGGTYYYSCTCGVIGTTTFVADNKSDNHIWDSWKNLNETQHYHECTVCNITEAALHIGGTATCSQQATCSECATGYGSLADHKFTETGYDGSNHWSKCSVCGTSKGDEAAHNLIWKSDASSHWQECQCGYKTTPVSHTLGTAATCTKAAVCSVCSQSYGSANGHSKGTLTSDSSVHWYTCNNCDAKLKEDATEGTIAHSYTKSTVSAEYLCEEATCGHGEYYYKSCNCGAASNSTASGMFFEYGDFTKHHFTLTTNGAMQNGEATATYTCTGCGAHATFTLSVNGGVANASDNIKEVIYKKDTVQKLAVITTAGSWSGADGYVTPTISYTSTADGTEDPTHVGIVTASATGDDGKLDISVTYRIIKAEQNPQIKLDQFIYNEVPPTPTVAGLEENPDVTFYYTSGSSTNLDDWTVWEGITATTLEPGNYKLRAQIAETDDYNPTLTAVAAFGFTVKKGNQYLNCANMNVPYEVVGAKILVSGYHCDYDDITYTMSESEFNKGIIELDRQTGSFSTLQGGSVVVNINAPGTQRFEPTTKAITINVGPRNLKVTGVAMSYPAENPNGIFYYGQEITFEGIPEASAGKLEKAVPGWTYTYVGRDGTVYPETTVPAVEPGDYNFKVNVLDGNSRYSGSQTVPFTIAPATPRLVLITPSAIDYGQKLTDSAVIGYAVNPYNGETVEGIWYFTDGEHAPKVNESNTPFEVTFVPTGAAIPRYVSTTGLACVKVNKITPIAITCACVDYIYDSVTAPAIPTISAFADGTRDAQVTYYYNDAMPESLTDGTTWAGITKTTLDAGKYYMFAKVDGDNYLTTYTAVIVFHVLKGYQVLNDDVTTSGDAVIIGTRDRGRDLEYCIGDGDEWINVPALNQDGAFILSGLANGDYPINIRVKESNNYWASPTKSAIATIYHASIAYNANGGMGSIPVSYPSGGSITVASADALSYEGYTFMHWSTNADGSGTTCAAGYVTDSAMTLYAQWQPNTYTVVFDGNGADGTMDDQPFTYDVADNLRNLTYTGNATTGSIFSGWAFSPDAPRFYTSGASVKNLTAEPDGVVTLYAIWADANYVISGNITAPADGQVKLVLRRGNLILDTQDGPITGLHGSYSMSGIPNGLYDLVATLTAGGITQTITMKVQVKDGNVTQHVVFTDSKANSILEVEPGTRQLVVANLNTEAENKREIDKEVVITMYVKDVEERQPAPTDTATEKAIQDGIRSIRAIERTANLEFINIDIFEHVSSSALGIDETTQIRNTHNVLEIVIPFDTTGKTTVQVYRSHNGVAAELRKLSSIPAPSAYVDGTFYVDWENALIYLYAKKYSVYAIGYNAPEYGGGGVGGGGAALELTPEGICPRDNTCPIEPYTDAINDSWYHDGVHYCIENGIMIGRTDTLFVPNGNIRRSEILTMLWRLAGSPKVECEVPFVDVWPNVYYEDALRWGFATGVITGYRDELFGPKNYVTREQLAAMLFRYAELFGSTDTTERTPITKFNDASRVRAYAVEAFEWCSAKGIIVGREDNTIHPRDNATRAEAACMTQRFCHLIGYEGIEVD